MSEDGFLSRWSRRKAAAREAPAPVVEPEPVPELPPIESLGVDSDYTVFLARGVSQAVQAQALRVAWASDPAIANFRGMAEYAWDFNAPGYGALAAGDDAAAWLSQIVRSGAKLVTAIEPAAQLPDPPPEELPQAATPIALAPEPAIPIAAADPLPAAAQPEPVSALRRHGGAMPV